MSKFLLAFASLALLFLSSSALYKHQVGEFDWNIRTIGDIEKLHFHGNRASFITKDGFIGTFAANTGMSYILPNIYPQQAMLNGVEISPLLEPLQI